MRAETDLGLGIIREKRKHEEYKEDDVYSYISREDYNKDYGCRDDTFRGGSECYEPTPKTEDISSEGASSDDTNGDNSAEESRDQDLAERRGSQRLLA